MAETPSQTRKRLLFLLHLVGDTASVASWYMNPEIKDDWDKINKLVTSAHDALTEARALIAAKMKGAW